MTTRSTTPILGIKALKKYFPVRRGFFQRIRSHVRAVDGVDLAIYDRQTLGLVGESGCGKSTVARLILRLLNPDGGSIRFDGRDITTLDEGAFKPLRRRMQMVFQDPYSSLNPRLTVAQTLSDGLRMAGIKDPSGQRERVRELLTMVGMPAASADRYPHEFSGGQRQRVGIARALSVSPQLLLCDEPISALDVSIQAQIINLLKDLQQELGLSYLFISHDLNVVSYICDHVCVMYSGRIVESAPTNALFDHPCHPYTLNLLAAVPDVAPDRKMTSRAIVSGEGPAPINTPAGCRFHQRCAYARSRCHAESPALVSFSGSSSASEGDHWVACHFAGQLGNRGS